MTPLIAPNGSDQEAQAALKKVKLDVFTAEPSTVEPFTTSTITWEVTVPREVDIPIQIEFNGAWVAASGQVLVAPVSTTSYSITARTLGQSIVLGTITVQVDLTACTALSGEPVLLVTDAIKSYFPPDGSLYFRSTSGIVAIRGDRMIITLHLAKRIKHFPDPSIDINASFALDVVPIPPTGRAGGITSPFRYDFHELAPTSESVKVDVSFPWYVWLIPGAFPTLYFVISDAESSAQGQVGDMISQIVRLLNSWFIQSYVQPPKMDKHDAGFYVNPQGDQRFWINFCPVPPRLTEA